MTREEAITWLIQPTVTSTKVSASKAKEQEAYDMAIEALQVEPTKAVCDDCIWHVCNYNKVDWDTPSAEVVHKPDYSYEADMVRRIKEALSADRPTKHTLPDGTKIPIDEESYEIGYTHGQMADRPTGEWILNPNGMDWNIPAWQCSECGFTASHIGVEPNGLGNSPMNWAGSKFCPQCGVKIIGYER